MFNPQTISCKICKNVVQASVWMMHCMGKKHMHFTPYRVTVAGNFPNMQSININDIHDYFATFGTIGRKIVSIDGTALSIEYGFQDRRSHSKIIYKRHVLFGQVLNVSWKEVTEPLPAHWGGKHPMKTKHKTKKADSETTRHNRVQKLRQPPRFEDQIRLLQAEVQNDNDEMESKRKIIQDDLMSALAPVFTMCQIHYFGSSVTGLDVEGSDLDVYVANVREDNRSDGSILKFMKVLIHKCNKFCDVLFIFGAKTPIIKCMHTQTGMCCDLNIKNKLAVRNSQLIRYYVDLDEKLRPLMIFLKFWADCQGMKKTNYFSSYSLYLMVIFYLQHPPYNLPSVEALQKGIDPDLVEGWNCAFNSLTYDNSALREVSMLNLIKGFFEFYVKFDYTSYVVAPYLGRALRKDCFLKPYNLDGYEEFKNRGLDLPPGTTICVQDPFEHDRNIVPGIPFNCIGTFINLCQDCMNRMNLSEFEMLYNVLTLKINPVYTFTIDKQDCEGWAEKVKKLIETIVTDVMYKKILKVGDALMCTGDYNIWDNRVETSKKYTGGSLLEREKAVTDHLIKHYSRKVTLEFFIEPEIKDTGIEISVRSIDKKMKSLFHAGHFLRMKLLECLNASEASSPLRFVEMTDEVNEDRPSRSLQDDDQEDVPADFFDDFANDDFMDGLDIVDAWDDDRIKKEENGFSKEGKHSPIRFLHSSPRAKVKRHKSISLTRSFKKTGSDRRRSRTRSRSRDKGKQLERERRDPEKTKRDINKDKLRVAKDKEQKIVNDALRIVETGLVPPGMETEVDVNAILREKERERKEKDRERLDQEQRDSAKEREKLIRERQQKVERERQERNSELDKTEKYRSTTVSSLEKARVTRLDRIRDREDRDRELGREKERQRDKQTEIEREQRPWEREKGEREREKGDPVRQRERDREREQRNREWEREQREREKEKELKKLKGANQALRERSPHYQSRKRANSSSSNLSEREMWMRTGTKEKRSRSSSRSRSGASRKRTHTNSRSRSRDRSKKYEDMLKKKRTFLEEIRDKLNETTRSIPSPILQTYNPVPVPAPAPLPYFPSQNPQGAPMQNYDQQFFIGEQFPPQNVLNPQNLMNVVTQPQVPFNVAVPAGVRMYRPVGVLPQTMVMPQHPVTRQTVLVQSQLVVNKPQAMVSPKILSDIIVKPRTKQNDADASKLFADKKISLSDFLAITAKCEAHDSSPEHLQKKIKVISRCQDAIRAMSDERTYTGRLQVKSTASSDKASKTSEIQYQSPLRKIPVVRFPFTTPTKTTDELDGFAIALDKILLKVGILKETIDLDVPDTKSKTSFADEESAALNMKAQFLAASKREQEKKECEECKKRKMITFTEVGSQCAEFETVDAATQVTEEDITPSIIPKNDSIAYLTPAQLLGKQKEEKNTCKTPENTQAKAPTFPKKEAPPSRPKFPPTPRGGFKPLHSRQRDFYMERQDFMENDYGYEYEQRFTRPLMDSYRDDYLDFAQPIRGRGRGRGGRFPYGF